MLHRLEHGHGYGPVTISAGIHLASGSVDSDDSSRLETLATVPLHLHAGKQLALGRARCGRTLALEDVNDGSVEVAKLSVRELAGEDG